MTIEQDQPIPVISAIAAVARNGVIGRDNAMPWHLSGDLRYFKRMTLGKPVIMGRKSFDSLGKPLPGRLNIVVTRNPASFRHEGVTVASNIADALAAARANHPAEIMIIGGAQIYAAAMPFIGRLYLTRIDRDYDGDTFFPAFDMAVWTVVSSEAQDGDPPYSFTILERATGPSAS